MLNNNAEIVFRKILNRVTAAEDQRSYVELVFGLMGVFTSAILMHY